MTTPVTARWRAALNTRLMNDADRENLVTGVQKAAPTSPLFPVIAVSFAALGLKGAAFVAGVTAAAASKKVWRVSVAERDAARTAFDRELDTFKTLVENNASSAADVIGTGFAILVRGGARQAPPDPPEALLVTFGKARREARVTVQGRGYLGRFVAEMASDPALLWSSLPGTGKQRILTGASGTRVWVRFARVRSGMQSAWSTPVLVILP
jgi:hypothetical protein